jgi:hypothetical protein
VRVIKEKNKKSQNQRAKVKMTNQNAKLSTFALSLRVPIYRDEAISALTICHCEAGVASRSNLGEERGQGIATLRSQ